MAENDGFSLDQIRVRRMRFSDTSADFACSKAEFEDYFAVTSMYDQQEHMGQPHVFLWNGRIVDYLVLAMDRLHEDQGRLGIDTFGKIPSLLISHLAVDRRYVRRGIGSFAVRWAIKLARDMSGTVGCRVVLVKSEPDVMEFYEKIGFDKTSKTGANLTDMYVDIKRPQGGRA